MALRGATLLGAVHFLAVGVPFIAASGRGEGLMYIIFVDFPLFVLAQALAPAQLYNSALFNFLLFAVGGTFMYAIIGALLGWLAGVLAAKRRS